MRQLLILNDMNNEKIQLRRLGATDVVKGFDCGDDDLNDFIKTDALLYYRVRLATRSPSTPTPKPCLSTSS